MSEVITPRFSDLLGQENLVNHFISLRKEERIPHALLLVGEDGSEALPLAFAIARTILCERNEVDGSPCGSCQSCQMVNHLEHPDLTLVYPVVRIDDQTTSLDYFKQFKSLMASHKRFTEKEWRDMQDAKNKQLQIMVAEAERLIKITSLRSFKSRHQVILIWMPERFRIETSNKLLKLLEEPPSGVIFIMVSHQPSNLLPTIMSRLHKVLVPAIPKDTLIHYLAKQCGLPNTIAAEHGHIARGNLYRALSYSDVKSSELAEMKKAVELLLIPLQRDPKVFLEHSKEVATLNRPDVISLLKMLPVVLREILAMRYGDDEVVYLTDGLKADCRQVLGKIDHKNITIIMEDITAAINEIQQNANVKMVFF